MADRLSKTPNAALAESFVFRRYLARFAIFSGIALLLVVTANALVFVRRPPPTEWHNQPFFFRDVGKKSPDVVVIGSSRVDAFRTHPFGDPRVVAVDRNRFDFGPDAATYAVLTLYNASFGEVALGTKASRALDKARTVYVGLDFFAVNAFFQGSHQYPVGWNQTARVWYMRFASAQQWLDAPFSQAFSRTTRYIPPANKVEVFHLAIQRYFRKLFENGNNLNELTYPLIGYSPAIAALREMLKDFEQGSAKELVLFITPTHAWALEAVDLVGRWPEYEAWRRLLVAEVQQANGRLAPGRSVTLWDFDGHHCIASQAVRSSEVPFWDNVDHHNSDVARMMLAQMRGYPSRVAASGCRTTEFGTRLTAANIDAHLQRLRHLKADYRGNFPDQVDAVEHIFRRETSFRQRLY
jgi:hypothetical protein